MAMKFLSLEEAAQQIGVTADELNEMRQRQEIYGYRDGASWKFKPEEVQRVIDDRAGGGASDSSGDLFSLSDPLDLGDGVEMGDPLELGDPLDLDDSAALGAPPKSAPAGQVDAGEFSDDMVLLSELELGESGSGSSATVIGKPGNASAEESDVRLAEPDTSGSQTIVGQPGAPLAAHESDIKLRTGAEPSAGESATVLGQPGKSASDSSSIKLTSPLAEGPSASATMLGIPGAADAGESDVRIVSAGESSLPIGLGGSGVDLVDDEPTARIADDSGLTLADDDLTLDSEPTLSFDDSSSDDYVLSDDGAGSDITISPADSGISLVDPADSGLSLDKPLDLGPAGGAQAFELGEDSAEVGELEFDSDEVSGVQASDDFLLTPLGEDSEEVESGSQVIAMEDSASFQASEDMFAEDSSEVSMLEAVGDEGISPLGDGGLEESSPALARAGVGASREQPYPAWIVGTLAVNFVVLGLCGMMMYDLMRNMWSFGETYSLSSTMLDTLGSWTGLK